MMLIDSHCHLDFDSLTADRPAVMRRARAAGVGGVLTIGTRRNNAAIVKQIAESEPHVWCTIGLHPHEADKDQLSTDELMALADHPKVIGIGETGLDYYYENAAHDRQEESFRAHCRAARTLGLPLVVHARNADRRIAEVLDEESGGGRLRGVLHCFSSGAELADTALELGFYISFSGIVTFKNAAAVRAIVPRVPRERLLVETDAPYLAPVPHRGRPNEPALLVHTAECVANLLGIETAELAAATGENFFRLFDRARQTV
jgi:TatD DNase family protein